MILPNLILGRSVVPEFIQEEATAEVLSGNLLAAMAEGGKRQEQLDGFAEVETIMRLMLSALHHCRAPIIRAR